MILNIILLLLLNFKQSNRNFIIQNFNQNLINFEFDDVVICTFITKVYFHMKTGT